METALSEARAVFSQGETFVDGRHPALRRAAAGERRDLNVLVLVMAAAVADYRRRNPDP